ncbi:YqcC family protein [Reinekea sp. G2M2-21]|uniref:YqcC family protein n=1 Tax=Reinekea sp. G2M2-21 TaxID=2788942 RepID=UPI0018A8FABC|nr:YqcC family protein [Reinekea sp. G2M2-21]
MTQAVLELLAEIEGLLQKHNQWQTIPPTAEKMASTEPFSIDTLTFLEWLQWVYLARLRAVIHAGATLPQGAMVLPYAQEALRADGIQIPGLLSLIEQLDDALQ